MPKNRYDIKKDPAEMTREELDTLLNDHAEDLTSRQMTQLIGIMRGKEIAPKAEEGQPLTDEQKKYQADLDKKYQDLWKKVDDKAKAELEEQKVDDKRLEDYEKIKDVKDKNLTAEQMQMKYTMKQELGEEVDDNIWDKINEKEIKEKTGGKIVKDSDDYKREEQERQQKKEQKLNEKYEKEYGDIKKGIEGIGEPENPEKEEPKQELSEDDMLINDENSINNVLYGDVIDDDRIDDDLRRQAQVKNAQLYEEIVTEEMEGLEELQEAAYDPEKTRDDMLNKQKDKPDEFTKEDLFTLQQSTILAAQMKNNPNGGRFEVGEDNNAPQVDYVKMMMQNNPRYKEFLEFQAMQEAVNKQEEPKPVEQEVKPNEEPKKEEKEPEKENKEPQQEENKVEQQVKPEQNVPQEKKPEEGPKPEDGKKPEENKGPKPEEKKEPTPEEKLAEMAQKLQNKPRFEVELDPELAKKEEYKKQEEKSEKKLKEINEEINKEFKVEKGEDGKEIDNADNHLFMDEKQEEAREQELAKEEQAKQQEKEANEKKWEEQKEAHPELYDKNSLEYKQQQEELAFNRKYYPDAFDKDGNLKKDAKFGDPQMSPADREEALESVTGGKEENHRPDASILMQIKLLINALIPALFAKECAAYHKANAEYYKTEGKIEKSFKDKVEKEKADMKKRHQVELKEREAEKKQAERDRKQEERDKKMDELLAQKNNPQKDVNVPQGNTVAEQNQNKELNQKEKEVDKNKENTLQQENPNKEENKDLQEVKKDEEKNKDVKKEELQQVGDSNKEVEKNFAPDDTRKASPERLAKLNDLSMKMKSNIPGVQKAAEESAKKELAGMLYDKAMANLLENTKGAQGKELYEKGMNPEVREKQIEKLLKSNDKRVQAALKPENLDKILARQGDAPLELFDTFKKVHKNEKLKDERDIRKILDKENNKKMEKEAENDFQNIGMGM